MYHLFSTILPFTEFKVIRSIMGSYHFYLDSWVVNARKVDSWMLKYNNMCNSAIFIFLNNW